MVTALMVKPNEHPCITQLCDDGKFLDLAVSLGTDMMCSARAMQLEKGVVILHACEGASLSLPGNRRVKRRIIPGIFYIVGVEKGKLRSLTDVEVAKYTSRYWEPEVFTQDEIIDSWFDDLFNMW